MGSFTTDLGLILPTPFDPSVANVWGTLLNTNFTLIDSAVSGLLSLSVAGSANVVLTSTQGAANQARHAMFVFTGILTGNINVLWPQGTTQIFMVTNSTTGAFTLSLGVNNGSSLPAGAVIAVPQGQTITVVSDGTNVTVTNTFALLSGGLIAHNTLSTDTGGFSDTSGTGFVTSFSGATVSFTPGGVFGVQAITVQATSGGVILNNGATAWAASSDETLKTPIIPFSDALHKVLQIRAGIGRFLTDDENVSRSFMSAQSVKTVLPEAVCLYPSNVDKANPLDGKLMLTITDVIPLLVAAIQELTAQVAALQAKS